MRVILMHNPTAGSEDHTAREMVRLIRRAGHEVLAEVTKRKELRAALESRCDLVAVAGGDGTIAKAAATLAGTGIPLTLIPVGTANNVALTLGFTAEPEELVRGWEDAVIRGFDRGMVLHAGKSEPFLESFGVGAFPEIIRRAKKLPDPPTRDEKLERDLALFQSVIEEADPVHLTISADGEDLSGDYLFVELMNIPYLGPNLSTAPVAASSDGRLDLIFASAKERSTLIEHLKKVRKGRKSILRLPARQIRQAVITSADRLYHLDGSLGGQGSRKWARTLFEISVEPHALQVLVPFSS